MEVRFYDTAEDRLLRFAVIVARSRGKWVFCKHRERDTLEVPGGRREPGETIAAAAERELREETGAAEFTLVPVCPYSVTGRTSVSPEGGETFGMLYYAEIERFEGQLHSEMEEVHLLPALPEKWTYPLIQPKLIEKYLSMQGGGHVL